MERVVQNCHRPVATYRPVGYLILFVASAFLLDIRLGIITWLVAAAHEVPQELGDFAVLDHGRTVETGPATRCVSTPLPDPAAEQPCWQPSTP
jgi:hypothetical protein